MTLVRDAFIEGLNRLKTAGIEEYESDTKILFEHITGIDHMKLLLDGNKEIDETKLAAFRQVIEKRISHIPVQHLTGIQYFMGYEFIVNENVLVPRFDTEILVENVISYLKDGMKVLDICTGSGCIAISLMLSKNNLEGLATDISEKALEVAKANKEKHSVSNLELINTDLVSGLESKYKDYFDVIVSNPPYIESKVIDTLSIEVKEHEPVLALDGGEDGLIFYRRLVDEALILLKDGGIFAVEIGYNQGQAVKELFENAKLREVRVIKDYAGLDRVVLGLK